MGQSHISVADAGSGLGWLVAAGADALVTETPRNWLADPVAAPHPVVAAAVQSALAPDTTRPATAIAAAAPDLGALETALLGCAHPLRRLDTPPQLLTGNIASGIIVLGDQPETADTPLARLTERMLAAIGLDAETCARAYLLPWGTAAGRPPRDDEFTAFAPFRVRAFELAAPRLILAFGDRAAALSGRPQGSPARGIASLRGKWLAIQGTPMLATFHPRILLTQPELKRLAWADLQAFAERVRP